MSRTLCAWLVLGSVLATRATAEPLVVWRLATAEAGLPEATWTPNANLRPVARTDQGLHLRSCGSDPLLTVSGIGFIPEAGTWLRLRIRADHSGRAIIRWTQEGPTLPVGATSTYFYVPESPDRAVDVAVIPSWRPGVAVTALRLDLFHFGAGCAFVVEEIAVERVPERADAGGGAWSFTGDALNGSLSAWRLTADSDLFLGPDLTTAGDAVSGLDWVSLRVRTRRPCSPAVVWVNADTGACGQCTVHLEPTPEPVVVNLQPAGDGLWGEHQARLGLLIPRELQADIEVFALSLNPGPVGSACLRPVFLGLEQGHCRAGRWYPVTALLENTGGRASAPTRLRLEADPEVLEIREMERSLEALGPGGRQTLRWDVRALAPGGVPVRLVEVGNGAEIGVVDLVFLPERELVSEAYVPEPEPIPTTRDVFAFYFPGWDTPAKWSPIRNTAPERRPLLGWYDESRVECVDWQIKWAVENGITGFIVDWYWNRGNVHLGHWLEAYRQARYRDRLKLFILWCDHAGNDIRDLDDMDRLADYWIRELFSLPGYHRIDGKPVVCLFDPGRLRAGLGGSERVREALDLCRRKAREHGYAGVFFMTGANNFPPEMAPTLAREGYDGGTTYHEPGYDWHDCPSLANRSFAYQVATAPAKWAAQFFAHPDVRYFPLVDSGWDSRPWHGSAASVVRGRTPEVFEEWLRRGEVFCRSHRIPLLVLGPLNEWGEGSYLEPCTEFGFGMYEAVRRVVATSPPDAWPGNLSPEDVGLGGYGFPDAVARTRWDFEQGPDQWTAGMGSQVRHEDGCLVLRTVSEDPSMVCDASLDAAALSTVTLRLRFERGESDKAEFTQFFWATENEPVSGAAFVGFAPVVDGQWHEYTLDLAAHPRWRGRIVQLRFDPSCVRDMTVAIDEIRLE